MRGAKTLVLVTEIWIYFVLLSATFGSSTMAKMSNMEKPGFISIDCGVDADYFDEDTGIYFKSDSEFVSTGKNQIVQEMDGTSNPYFGKQLINVRSFEEGTRNCYTLKPEQGRHNNYLIRASFFYGNYDGENQFPTFDLYLGVNFWKRVELTIFNKWHTSEILHFSSSNRIDVCLINTGNGGVPVISALELRLVNSSSYIGHSFSTLETIWRVDVGHLSDVIRYKDDPYDRKWWPNLFAHSDWKPSASTLNIDIQEDNDNNKVPVDVFRTAAMPGTNQSSLSYSYTDENPWRNLYVNLYFFEIEKILPGQRRKFTITINGDDYGAFTLENSKPLTIRSNRSVGVLNFTINPTQDSTLPPILNAFETFGELNLTKPATNQADVDAMTDIKDIYKINKIDWQGDPCLPSNYIWTGLSCSSNSSIALSKIISLNLSSSNLRGEIISAFSNLQEMQNLDLSFNELTGTVPEFLGKLPNLTILNLNENKLSGVIPQILIEKAKSGLLQLSFDGNPKLCPNAPCEKTKKSLILPIIASIVSIMVFLVLGIMIILWIMKIHRVTKCSSKGSLLKSKNHSLTHSEIISITNNFREVIGEGGFGKVYLGKLSDGNQVAVKLLSESSKQGHKEFLTEVELLLVVHHRSLVPLLGYCNGKGIMALVYDYMENGNLRQHLSGSRADVMSWEKRLQIAIDAAHGLDYLHNGCKPPIIHRDFKSSNILLTGDLQAKISDFGLSRALKTLEDTHVTTQPAGTFGYFDPSCALGIFNKKTDTYSFGVVLLELITGQPAVIRVEDDRYHVISVEDNHCHVIKWTQSLIERGDINSIVDPKLQGEFNPSSAWKAVEIAMSCVAPNATQRPDMIDVVVGLKASLSMEMASGDDKKTENCTTVLSNQQDTSLTLPR